MINPDQQPLRRRSSAEFDLDGVQAVDNDLAFQPMSIDARSGQQSMVGSIDGRAPPQGTLAKATHELKKLLPGNLKNMGGAAVGALSKEAKDAFSLPSFMSVLAFINPSSYGKPGSAKVAIMRLKQNVVIYKRNYISIGVVLFLLTILTSPSILVPMLAIGACWIWLLSQHEDPEAEPTRMGPIVINKRNKCLVALPITLMIMWWLASAALSWCILLTVIIGGVHGVFHHAPEHMRAFANQAAIESGTGIPTHDTNPAVAAVEDAEDWWDLK